MPTPDRYTSKGRVLHTTITRTPWRHRQRTQRPVAQTQTQAEKAAAKQAKVERKIATNGTLEKALGDVWAIADRLHRELGTHTSHYWYEYLMQSAGKKDHERNASGWNAFLSRRIKEINNELPEGAPRLKASALAAQLSSEWQAMSSDERDAFAQDAKVSLMEIREMKKHSVHNADINSFHDARATLESLQNKLLSLYNRTGTETLMINVRSDGSSYMHPRIFSSSEKIDDWFHLRTNTTTSQFAGMMESYLLSGLEGSVKRYQGELAELKAKIARLIQEKLQFVVRPDRVGRMYYQNFEDHITRRFGVVIENWPLKEFTNPSNVPSRIELQTLFHAWDSGATYFRRLTPGELEARFAGRIQYALPQSGTTSTPPALPASSCVTVPNESPLISSSSSPSSPSSSSSPPSPSSSSSPLPLSSSSPFPSSSSSPLLPPPPATQPVNVFYVTTPTTAMTTYAVDQDGPGMPQRFGTGVIPSTSKQPRKVRSDKGKPRGPRKKKSSAA